MRLLSKLPNQNRRSGLDPAAIPEEGEVVIKSCYEEPRTSSSKGLLNAIETRKKLFQPQMTHNTSDVTSDVESSTSSEEEEEEEK